MMISLTKFGVHRASDAGSLMMEDVLLSDIAERFGTPCFVYSKLALVTAYQRLDAALRASRQSRPYLICYAVKANSNLSVLRVFADLGSGFDIVSGGELMRVLEAGGNPRKIVFSGLGKTAVELRLALRANIKCFNLESESELDRLNNVAGELGVIANISLRVNPDVDAKTHPYISTGLKNNKFGIAIDRAIPVYLRAAAMPHIRVTGVDCHIGSQLTDDKPLQEAMARIVALADALADKGVPVRHICPGGGIGITYKDEPTIDLVAYTNALEFSLGSRDVELLLEPGRVLVGNAGVLLSRVEFVKLTESKNFLVIDAAMNDLIRPSLYQAHHEVVMAGPLDAAAPTRVYDVVGPVCESADVLAHERALAAQESDTVAILSAGAYGFVMSSNYNSRPRAAELMVDGSTVSLIRARETFDDLVRQERLQYINSNID